MYLTGNLGNYTCRIHQLPESVSDVDNFISEGNTYLNSITINLSGKWERELRKRKYVLSHDPSYLVSQQLGNIASINYIYDENNNIIYDESNNGLLPEV